MDILIQLVQNQNQLPAEMGCLGFSMEEDCHYPLVEWFPIYSTNQQKKKIIVQIGKSSNKEFYYFVFQTLLVLLAIGAATADPFFLSLFGKGNNCECRNYYTKECKAKEDKARWFFVQIPQYFIPAATKL